MRMSNSRGSSHRDPELTAADVVMFEKLVAQLRGLRDEIGILSKSKPDNALNVLKLEFVNEKLTDANKLLVDDFKPFASFTLFDLEKLPSNSDVVLALSQYLVCLERWRCAHVYYDKTEYKWCWRVSDGDIEASPATQSHG